MATSCLSQNAIQIPEGTPNACVVVTECHEHFNLQSAILLSGEISVVLHNSIQGNVIEQQYRKMVSTIETSTDFASIRVAHEEFLSNLTSQLFLTVPTITRCIQQIVNQCRAFCKLVLNTHGNPEAIDLPKVYALTKVAYSLLLGSSPQEFDRQSVLLFQVLTTLRSKQSTSIGSFLLLVDYNKQFSKKAMFGISHMTYLTFVEYSTVNIGS